MAFAGTTQKCIACEHTVYLVDKLTVDNCVYHKACFRCHHCRSTLKLGNYNSFEGVLYCRPHFDQLFKRTGSLEKSFAETPKITKLENPIDFKQVTTPAAFIQTKTTTTEIFTMEDQNFQNIMWSTKICKLSNLNHGIIFWFLLMLLSSQIASRLRDILQMKDQFTKEKAR